LRQLFLAARSEDRENCALAPTAVAVLKSFARSVTVLQFRAGQEIEMSQSDIFTSAEPWPMPALENCRFYHCMDFPDGESVSGPWDLRGRFGQYIGNYSVAGKTVLDVGSSSGFLAFSAERAGATVTAMELENVAEINLLPFRSQPYYHGDRARWEAVVEQDWRLIKNAFWYAWYKYDSRVEMIYVPLSKLKYWDRRFDVVFAGAILEHLADPVSVIGELARLAKEAVIIAFTPVAHEDDLLMRTANDWSNPEHYFTWWTLSTGLYKRVFDNVGFDIQIFAASAKMHGQEASRHTIVARRRTR
jgi:2-polyprenyl-3-methyl-5-hydroxy-6-metoxy-1,4-benzoquinol methylase